MTHVHASVFDVVANDHDRRVIDGREASVRASVRAREGFGRWLSAARSLDEFEARLELAAPGLRDIVADVAGGSASVDPESLYTEVVAGLTPEVAKEAARRPHLCPYHGDMVDVALTSGDPAAGYQSVAPLRNTNEHCQGEDYEGARCKFRPEMTTQSFWDDRQQKLDERRELRQEQLQQEQPIQAEMPLEDVQIEAPVEPELEPELDGISEELTEAPSAVGFGAEDAPLEMAASFLASDATYFVAMVKEAPGSQHLPGASPKRNRQYEHIKEDCLKRGKSEDECKELAARTVNKQRSEHGETKDSAVPYDRNQPAWAAEPGLKGELECRHCGAPNNVDAQECYRCRAPLDDPIAGGNNPYTDMPGSQRRAEALRTEDVQKGRPDTPVPKMDKSKWTPDNPGPVGDVEMDGSPHPTRKQDVAETPTYTDAWSDDGRLDQTKAVAKKEDVTRKNEVKPETDNNFPGSRDLSAVSSEQGDDNPLREYLDALPSDDQVDAAISQYEE